MKLFLLSDGRAIWEERGTVLCPDMTVSVEAGDVSLTHNGAAFKGKFKPVEGENRICAWQGIKVWRAEPLIYKGGVLSVEAIPTEETTLKALEEIEALKKEISVLKERLKTHDTAIKGAHILKFN